ncbi:hypothetical protein OIU79_009045 [Salix purpurea]|uniref:Uncharacterized protein n=1 Tax=Salix purpurea TaxID=77065 RepID=A0A9Q0TJY4_SALPP|nr:hypothetical protein OIU79_009045 [Salix purpurea]
MAPITILVFLAALLALPLALIAHPANNPTSRITVVGVVYCDTCSTKAFSRHSYFLPGADVHVQCTFKANSPKTRENIEFSVNRTTDRYGVYKLEVPEVDGVDCEEGFAIESVCQASLIGSSSRVCNVPGHPKKISPRVGIIKKSCRNSYNSSKFFLPYFPPYGFQWPPFPNFPPLPSLPPLPPTALIASTASHCPPLPPLPSLPPLPPLPPFPSLPFPPWTPTPFLPFPSPPSLPFPFPPLPPAPSLFHPPPPPAFQSRRSKNMDTEYPFISTSASACI